MVSHILINYDSKPYLLRVISDDTLSFENIGINTMFFMWQRYQSVILSQEYTHQDIAFPYLWLSESFHEVQIHDSVITEVIKFVGAAS